MKFIAYLFISCFIFSCAAWRADETEFIGKYPKNLVLKTKPPKISLSLKRLEIKENNEIQHDEINEESRKIVLKQIEKAYRESGLFEIVDEDSPNKDMSVEVEVQRHFVGSTIMKFLTTLSVYLVPRRTSEELIITTKFLDKKNVLVGMVEKSESLITWHQFFMLFALPFSNTPSSVLDNAMVDLNRATLIDAFQDGLFVDINE